MCKLSRKTYFFHDFFKRPILYRAVWDFSLTCYLLDSVFHCDKILFMFRYYKSDEDVTSDKELKAYINEVSIHGTGKNGGIGRVNIRTNETV